MANEVGLTPLPEPTGRAMRAIAMAMAGPQYVLFDEGADEMTKGGEPGRTPRSAAAVSALSVSLADVRAAASSPVVGAADAPMQAAPDKFAKPPAAETADETTPRNRDGAAAGNGDEPTAAASESSVRVASSVATAADGPIIVGADVSAVSAEPATRSMELSMLRVLEFCCTDDGAGTPAIADTVETHSVVRGVPRELSEPTNELTSLVFDDTAFCEGAALVDVVEDRREASEPTVAIAPSGLHHAPLESVPAVSEVVITVSTNPLTIFVSLIVVFVNGAATITPAKAAPTPPYPSTASTRMVTLLDVVNVSLGIASDEATNVRELMDERATPGGASSSDLSRGCDEMMEAAAGAPPPNVHQLET